MDFDNFNRYCWTRSIGLTVSRNQAAEMMDYFGINKFVELYDLFMRWRGRVDIEGFDKTGVQFCDCGQVAIKTMKLNVGRMDHRNGKIKSGKPFLYYLCADCVKWV